jgi:hypothetical protein
VTTCRPWGVSRDGGMNKGIVHFLLSLLASLLVERERERKRETPTRLVGAQNIVVDSSYKPSLPKQLLLILRRRLRIHPWLLL